MLIHYFTAEYYFTITHFYFWQSTFLWYISHFK